jgi:Sulfotransferase family
MSTSINETPVYILLHIHKCGGTTNTNHLVKYLKPNAYLILYKNQNPLFESRPFIQTYISSLSPKKINTLRVIWGHGAYYGIHTLIPRPCRYVVFLRNPYNRLVSNYAYFLERTIKGIIIYRSNKRYILDRKGNIRAFDEWVRSKTIMHDYMTRFLYYKLFNKTIKGEVSVSQLNSVITALENFYQVGLVENRLDYAFLYKSLHIPLYAKRANITSRIFSPTVSNRSEINTYLSCDLKLYTYFREHPRPDVPVLNKVGLYCQLIKDYLTQSLT